MIKIDKLYSDSVALTAMSCFAVSIGLTSPAWAAASASEPQSRPPINSGASGGANPGGAGGSGYNPGGGGSSQNPGGGGYNPGSGGSGGGYNPGGSGGSGYNPGGSGYNPGHGGSYNPGANSRHNAIVFRDSNYRGSSVRFDGEIANLHNSGLNDEISSMRLRGAWLACTDAYFRGRCEVFRNSVRDLRQSGMNDRISSLRPIR